MTADEWEPSEEIWTAGAIAAARAYDILPFDLYVSPTRQVWQRYEHEVKTIIKAVRDLIIAEARPQIEAAERERVLNVIKEKLNSTDDSDYWAGLNSAIVSIEDYIKDSKP